MSQSLSLVHSLPNVAVADRDERLAAAHWGSPPTHRLDGVIAANSRNADFDDVDDATFREIVCRDVTVDEQLFQRLTRELEGFALVHAKAMQFDKSHTKKMFRSAQLTRGTGEFEYRGSRWIWAVIEVLREEYEIRLRFKTIPVGTRMRVLRWWP
jgi:hypothetical protein